MQSNNDQEIVQLFLCLLAHKLGLIQAKSTLGSSPYMLIASLIIFLYCIHILASYFPKSSLSSNNLKAKLFISFGFGHSPHHSLKRILCSPLSEYIAGA